ncbi:MAG: aspartate kinase, partial [Cetobacterium sp.]
VAKYIKKMKNSIDEIIVVVSAMGKKTNNLLKKAEYFGENLNKREIDMLLSIGEQESAALLSLALNTIECDSISYTGYQIGLKTIGKHCESEILEINTKFIEEKLNENKILVIAGFQGLNEKNDITTLGRGGSDTTAVALAGLLKCECKIYTDVDGVYTDDPKKNNLATKIPKLSYADMEYLSENGAKVMELKAVKIGKKYKVPIFVGESLGDENGTYITE